MLRPEPERRDMMVDQSANAIAHTAGGYGPPGGGGYPPGGGYGGPPPGGGGGGGFGGPPGGPGAPPGGGYGVPPGQQPPGGFGAPPGYPPPGGMGGMGGMPPGGDVNTTLTMILSIATLACCCMPLGIVALINVMNANKAKQTGDMATAQAKNKTALTMSIIGIVGGVVLWIAIIILQVLANPHAF